MNRVQVFHLLDGSSVAHSILNSMRNVVSSRSRPPCLGILYSDDPTSKPFKKSLESASLRVGVRLESVECNFDCTTDRIRSIVSKWNCDDNIDGIICSSSKFNPEFGSVAKSIISPKKNVEFLNQSISCRASATFKLLNASNVSLKDRHVVYFGLPDIHAEAIFKIFSRDSNKSSFSFVTQHSECLSDLTRAADILIVGTGCERSVKPSMIRPETVIIDLGFHGKKRGDVDLFDVMEKISHFGSMDSGVGRLTSALVLRNLVNAAAENAFYFVREALPKKV